MPSNSEFLSALFGADAPFVHVTDFTHDPNNVPNEQHLIAWKGDYFNRYQFKPQSNQYFTISNFYADTNGVARRRKALYKQTPVIVLDDVKEKLSLTEVSKLPPPSWVLETSQGSEQWGYILDTPCIERAKIENLLDGLVANGLAPNGRDPGMKGVTRYVRLPDGINNKSTKLVNGQPFKCQLTLWQPFNRVSLEQLAEPFAVNLDAVRREARVDGAADVADHPLLDIPDIITVKEVRSDGRFDIICPWVESHTGADDSGAAIFTNGDGTIGFKCHHGNCQSYTGRDLLQFVEGEAPGFNATLINWKATRAFSLIAPVSFIDPPPATTVPVSFIEPPPMSTMVTPAPVAPVISPLDSMLEALTRERPTTPEARHMAQELLKIVDELPQIEKVQWHNDVCRLMIWSKKEFRDILRDLREQWYMSSKSSQDFFENVIYIKEQNQFYDWKSRMFFTAEAFQNSFCHLDAEARKSALQDGRVTKVDRLDYAPKQPRIFQVGYITYGNAWFEGDEVMGEQGDASRWLDHWGEMGWKSNQKHMLQWMAYTLLHPEEKINHFLLLGGLEGCGKDYLLYPLLKAMGENGIVISGDELLDSFNDYVWSIKYLHVNETELGDHRDALIVSNKLKPLAAAPPDKLRVNPKGVKRFNIRNIVNGTMTTNSRLPFQQRGGPSRRFYAAWSDLNTRDEEDETKPEWMDYWDDRWRWMKNGGAEMCIWYLRNCVDISKFNPAAPPAMTDFMRDIRDASKTPAQQTVEEFIRLRIGSFRSDLVTSTDAVHSLKAGPLIAPDSMYCDSKLFTPNRLGLVLKELTGVIALRASKGPAAARLWCVRNSVKYQSMSMTELYSEYETQIAEARSAAPPFQIVDGGKL